MQPNLFGTAADPKHNPGMTAIEPPAAEPVKTSPVNRSRTKAPANLDSAALEALQTLLSTLTPKTQDLDPEAVREIVRDEVLKHPAPYIEIKNTTTGTTKQINGPVPAAFKRTLTLAQARKNILLVGPTGSGKTHMAEMVSEALGLRFAFISLSSGLSEAQLAGWRLPGNNGEWTYFPAPFVDFYKNGGVFLLDEMDNGDPNTLTFINAALANGHICIPQNFEEPVIKKHPDFVLIAAANTFGNGADRQYVGRNQLDAATLDRFKIGTVYMDYDPTVETALVTPAILKWGRSTRETMKSAGLRRILSTRFLRDLSEMAQLDPETWGEKANWIEALTIDWKEDERTRL